MPGVHHSTGYLCSCACQLPTAAPAQTFTAPSCDITHPGYAGEGRHLPPADQLEATVASPDQSGPSTRPCP